MRTSDFNFDLPSELIARYPLEKRSDSRLLLLSHSSFQHHIFSELPDLLNENDVLIFNNTKVIPARLLGRKNTGGKVEILIERILGDNYALAHIKSNKSLVLPQSIFLVNDLRVSICERCEDLFKVKFESDLNVREILQQVGMVPLPPYMQREAEHLDFDRYQTVYSQHEGAVAAPTAGLHFDTGLMERLRQKNIQMGFITLHVGAGTFKPVMVEDIYQHKMHKEYFKISAEVSDLVNRARLQGGRVIAVGTTTVRALETAMHHSDQLDPCSGETNIFIYPGYRFKCIDALITNFHLPKSTLLMLVCALGGYERVMQGYQVAIEKGYRFYSYGDAMFIESNKL